MHPFNDYLIRVRREHISEHGILEILPEAYLKEGFALQTLLRLRQSCMPAIEYNLLEITIRCSPFTCTAQVSTVVWSSDLLCAWVWCNVCGRVLWCGVVTCTATVLQLQCSECCCVVLQ